MANAIRKRIALAAVAALGSALIVATPSQAVTETVTGSVSPVRVTFTGATRDAVPAATLTFTTTAALQDSTTSAVLTVVTAPSALAQVNAGQQTDSSDYDSLAAAAGAVAAGDLLAADAAAGSVSVPLYLSDTSVAAGTYTGTLVISDSLGSDVVTVNWSFTTTGAPASMTAVQKSATVLKSGVDTLAVTVKDATGKTTQISNVDSLALTASAGVISDGLATGDTLTVTAAEIAKGTIDLTYTAAATAGSPTVTVTPNGVLPTQGLTAQTVTYTVAGEIVGTAVDTVTVSAPASAVAVAGGARVQSGTSSVTFAFTGVEETTTVARYHAHVSGGTINGAAATSAAPQPFDVTLDKDGKGTLTLTLGGNALLAGATLVLQQVNVTAGNVGSTFTVTQTDPTVDSTTVTVTPSAGVVRALGGSTNVVVTVEDQFGNAAAGWTVRVYRAATDGAQATANQLGQAVTGADGTATIAVTNASTLTAAGAETYTAAIFAPSIGTRIFIPTTVVVDYTATGAITGLSVAVDGGSNGVTSPLVAAIGTTTATSQTVLPAIVVPTDGTADDATGNETYTVSTKAKAGTLTREIFAIQADATPNNPSVVTVTEGAFLSKDNSAAWNENVTTLTVEDNTAFYVYATKTGTHTVTITSGGATRTVDFYAYNLETDYYTVSADVATLSVAAGAYKAVTVTVKDIFGNVVNTAANTITVTASGAVLLGGLSNSATYDTDADGKFAFTVIGNNVAGTGIVTIAGPSANAFAAGYTKPTGAGDPLASISMSATVTASAADTAAAANAAAIAKVQEQVTALAASVTTLIAALSGQVKRLQTALTNLRKLVRSL